MKRCVQLGGPIEEALMAMFLTIVVTGRRSNIEASTALQLFSIAPEKHNKADGNREDSDDGEKAAS